MSLDIRYQIAINREPDPDLTALVEWIEVTQSIEKPWSFRIRFATDIGESELTLVDDQRLMPGEPDTEVSVLASVDDQTTCLVHGILTNRQQSVLTGGPGSWLEIQGSDRRILMDREFRVSHHEGKASEIVEKILRNYDFEVDVDPTTIEYREDENTLAQVGTDLEFMDELAGANGVYFWVDCAASSSLFGGFELTETAHFKASPPRPQDSGPFASLVSILAPDTPPKLTINTNDGISSLIQLEHASNAEVINQTPPLLRINIDDAQVEDTEVSGPSDDPLGEVQPPPQVRTRRIVSAGSVEEARVRNQAALNDAAWSVNARAETTVYAMGAVIQPHQLIEVAGAGVEKDGSYLVKSVTHHINPADHTMQLELLRNALGG